MFTKRIIPCLDVNDGRVVNGMKTFSATFRTISTTVFLASEDAVISRNTSSSAPALSYASAIATGSPASIKLQNSHLLLLCRH